MANRPRGYGMSASIKKKINDKYDEGMEQQARVWLEAIVEEPLSDQEIGSRHFQAALKDGTYLCRLAIKLGATIKIHNQSMAFKQMENISNFLSFCETYGLLKTDLFQTVDLYEHQNMGQVLTGIHALGRKAQTNGYTGPALGPKEAQQNVREFSEEQLRAGEGVIGLQAGTNKVASQAGMSFGTQRHIID